LYNIFKSLMNSNTTLNQEHKELLEKLTANDRTLHDSSWLKKRLEFLYNNEKHKKWGWKEPNTHIIIERLLQREENLKFIYVYRNGLDMAYSSNQNQLKLWGDIFFNTKNIPITPKNSLKYWCITHKRMLELKETYKERVLLFDFDNLCINPNDELSTLSEFLNINLDNLDKLKSIIKKPYSIGRYKSKNPTLFDDDDISFMKSIYKIDKYE
ncbi:MAG: sulfotransferase, partial [Campylobacteraceae bacterium]|nr:sulfotransferase [Campylobacteraceae bacterium]